MALAAPAAAAVAPAFVPALALVRTSMPAAVLAQRVAAIRTAALPAGMHTARCICARTVAATSS